MNLQAPPANNVAATPPPSPVENYKQAASKTILFEQRLAAGKRLLDQITSANSGQEKTRRQYPAVL